MISLRWILFLPAAFVSGVIASFLLRVGSTIFPEVLRLLASGAGGAAVMILTGINVAPRKTKLAKWSLILLAALLGLLCALGSLFADQNKQEAAIVGAAMVVTAFAFSAIKTEMNDCEHSSDSRLSHTWAAFWGMLGATIIGIIMVVSLLSGTVAGIWLVILGYWEIVILGFALSFLMPWCFIIAVLPGMLGAFLSIWLKDRFRIASLFVEYLTCVYNLALIQAWVLFVFFFAAIKAESSINAFPMALWAYSVTLSPLAYMARGESADAIGTNMGFLSAQLTSVLFLFLWVLRASAIILPIAVLIILIGAGIQVYLMKALQTAKGESSADSGQFEQSS